MGDALFAASNMVFALLFQDYQCTPLNCTGPGTGKMLLCVFCFEQSSLVVVVLYLGDTQSANVGMLSAYMAACSAQYFPWLYATYCSSAQLLMLFQ